MTQLRGKGDYAMAVKTVTLAQIKSLKWARDMAESWKGNQDPESYDEFDAWIAEVDEALRQVRKDRANYRVMLQHAASRAKGKRHGNQKVL